MQVSDDKYQINYKKGVINNEQKERAINNEKI